LSIAQKTQFESIRSRLTPAFFASSSEKDARRDVFTTTHGKKMGRREAGPSADA
jgi:hypothetical protein